MLTRRAWLGSAIALAAQPLTAGFAWARSALPFKLFDAHAHLKSDDLQRYPRAPIAAPGPGPAPPQPTGETPEVVRVLRWMDLSGVAGGAAVQHRGTYGYDNRYILDSTDQYRARLVPVVVLNAEDPQTPAMVRQLVREHGLAGVRLTGMRGADGGFPWFDSAAARDTWAAVNEAGLVMDLMTVPPGPAPEALAEYARLAQRYPQARLVLDHCAWPNAEGAPEFGIDAAHRELARHRNIYYKFTTVNLEALRLARVPAGEALRHLVAVYGADHLMWGSDIGNSAGLYGEMVARIVAASALLRAAERRQLLHDTGQAVLVRGGSHG
jgi:predicted TIM-barrel fold metal-dependent hydrolase